MKKPGASRASRGLSLIEILIAMVLLSTVMMAFAMVFPSGYRLTLRNDNESKATKIGYAIIGEITSLPFRAPGDTSAPSSGGTIRSIFDLQQYWRPNTTQAYGFPVTRTPDGQSLVEPSSFFRLNPSASTSFTSDDPRGILVEFSSDQSIARVKVTIQWDESLKTKTIRKKVSFYTMRARNH